MNCSRQLSLLVALALLPVGCATKEDRLADDFEVFAREMCRCDTAECADGLDKKRDMVRSKMKDLFETKDDAPKKLVERMDDIDSKFKKCRATVRVNAAIADLAMLRTKMCRCKGMPCVEEVNRDLSKLVEKHKGVSAHPDYERRAKATVGAYKKCMMDATRGPQ